MKRKKPNMMLKIPKINADSTTIQAKHVTTKIYAEENGHLTEFTVNGVVIGTSLILSVSDIKQFAIKRPNGDIKRRIVIDHEAEWKSKYKIAMDESAKKLWPDTYDQT